MYPPKTPIDFSKMAHLQIKTIPDVLVWTSPSNKISPKIAGAFVKKFIKK